MSHAIVALDVPLLSGSHPLSPLVVVPREGLKDLSAHAVMNTCLVAVSSESFLSDEEFGDLYLSRTPVVLQTRGAIYYLFSNQSAVWRVHEPARKGSGDSQALYPADFDGAHCFGMIQCIGKGGVTSNHFHSNKEVRERWVGTAGAARFYGSSSNYPFSEIGVGRTVLAGECEAHQTRADCNLDFECFLLVHRTTRAAHMNDHVYVPQLRVVQKIST